LRAGNTARRETRYRNARRIPSGGNLPVIAGHFTRWTKMAVLAASDRIRTEFRRCAGIEREAGLPVPVDE
jgi:hypothetical protein